MTIQIKANEKYFHKRFFLVFQVHVFVNLTINTYQKFMMQTRNLHKPDKCKSEADEDLGDSTCWSDAVGNMGVISVPETD